MTKEELVQMLEAQVASGEITADEAEQEYRDFIESGEGRWGWGWER
jgi:hypothetical protein